MTPAQQRMAKAREKMLANKAKAKEAQKPEEKVAKVVPSPQPSKRKVLPVNELDKMWHFQLSRDYPENWFPVDKRTGKLHKAPFPHYYVIPNKGIAWDENYKDEAGNPSPRARKWRYIEGQSSIWEDEQELDNFDDKQIEQMLGQTENQIVFEYGQLHVRGIQKLKLAALQVQDMFEGKERQYQPKIREYKLLNPEKQLEKEMTMLDKQFKAEQMARGCDTDKMVECAFVMGIDTTDLSDAGISKIRYEFLKKAKYDPQNPKGLDWFIGILNNSSTHVRYIFATAISDGLLSATQQPNKLTWAQGNTAIMDINSNGDVVTELVTKYIDGDELALKLLPQLEGQLFESV